MSKQSRPEVVTVRLSSEERFLLEALESHLGVNQSGIMRMALRRLAKLEGIEAQKEKPRKP